MLQLHGTLMRGGTSKLWIFHQHELFDNRDELDIDSILLAAFGSVEKSQIDGIGGGTSTTSKAAFVRPASSQDVDVEYQFAQVGTTSPTVEWVSNCGNCASAVALYTLQSGLVDCQSDISTVTMRNINTGDRLRAAIATPGGVVPANGNTVVPGCRATGVAVDLSFLDTSGSTTGSLLPTQHPIDVIDGVRCTLIDSGAPAALADAHDLAANACESLDDFASIVPALVGLRRRAAIRMGISRPDEPVLAAVPKVGIIGPPETYRTTQCEVVPAEDYDLAARMVSMHQPHPSIGLTSAVAIATAAALPGTLPGAIASSRPETSVVRLGTPVGVMSASVVTGADGGVASVGFRRAARRIADATIWVPYAKARADDQSRVRPMKTAGVDNGLVAINN